MLLLRSGKYAVAAYFHDKNIDIRNITAYAFAKLSFQILLSEVMDYTGGTYPHQCFGIMDIN